MSFIFRKPSLSYVHNIFTLPFSRSVWISSFSLIILLILTLYFIIRYERKYNSEPNWKGLPDTISDISLMIIGYMCVQGSTREPNLPGGRTAILFGSIALMFLYVSYSANIVTLLQSTADTINSLEDLLDSGLQLGSEDTIYNRYYFPVSPGERRTPKRLTEPAPPQRNTEKIRKAIYDRKIGPPGKEPNFHTMEYGIARVRQGFYGFHAQRGVAYKLIKETFYEDEKCGLQEVGNYIEVVDPWYTMRKDSPYKEIIRVG